MSAMRRIGRAAAVLLLCCSNNSHTAVLASSPVAAFATTAATATAAQRRVGSQQSSRFMGQGFRLVQRQKAKKPSRSTTTSSSLNMFLGTNEGILGVGTPEVFTILLVGYFVLGPNDLYKLVKEIGVYVQNFRTLGTQAAETFQSTMESNLELQEIRKAQRELNDAFTFRRTINVEEEKDAFATTVDSDRKGVSVGDEREEGGAAAEQTVGGVKGEKPATKRKKKMKKKKKKAVVAQDEIPADQTGDEYAPLPDLEAEMGLYPDLEMPSEPEPVVADGDTLRQERMERLASGTQPSTPDRYDGGEVPGVAPMDPEMAQMEQDRFAAQMSGSWNQQILDNQELLDPMAKIMQKIALLEEEKQAADARLEEEFALRQELEEKYYRQKKELLEEAVAEVQANAFGATAANSTDTGMA